MRLRHFIASSVVVALCSIIAPGAQQKDAQQKHESCPLHKKHQAGMSDASEGSHDHQDNHLAEVNRRGDHAMGFSHLKTTHHFRLADDGGSIEVTADDPADIASRDQVRRHLAEIAESFKSGDFEKPAQTHGKVPPGISVMKNLKRKINYKYEEIETGGRVRISTNNQEALRAIHDFLRFQIEDHQTGDSTEIEKRR